MSLQKIDELIDECNDNRCAVGDEDAREGACVRVPLYTLTADEELARLGAENDRLRNNLAEVSR